jgi:plasmid maintenance system antidote protein VapI
MREQNLAKIVRERMQAKGVTPYRLAQLTGMTRQTVGNFVNAGKPITSTRLALILAELDLIVVPVEGKE